MQTPKKNLWILWFGIFLILPVFLNKKIKISDRNFKNRLTNIYGGFLPDTVEFCNQAIHHLSWNIRSIIEKEFKRHINKDKAWELHYKRSMFWKPLIVSILKDNGLPEDLFYICVTESKCSNVVSPAGAAGFWQLMPATAKHYNLLIDSCIDERLHPVKSTKAVCEYFKYLYQKLHDWALVTVAYNAGLERVLTIMENQNTKRIDSIHINSESKRFLYRVISVKYLFEHPEYFRVTFHEISGMKNEIKIHSFKKEKDFNAFAKKHASWKSYNPWILCNDYPFNKEHQFLISENKKLPPVFIFGYYKSGHPSGSGPDSVSINKDTTDHSL